MTGRIVLDWGTSAFRAAFVAEDGRVLDRRAAALGIRFSQGTDFEAAMRREIGPWLDAHPDAPVYAAGMIGSRNGWIEVPYVACPADAPALAKGARRLKLGDGREMVFLPGVTCRRAGGVADVMRGEETQIAGLALETPATVILPGTHSKWVQVADGRIIEFQSFVTGELYDLLATHSFVAGARGRDGARFDRQAFDRGLAAGGSDDAASGGLLSRLFGVRARMLTREVVPEAIGDFLSGLLIGAEFREARAAGWLDGARPVTLAGSATLVERYRQAASAIGIDAAVADGDAGIRGALAIARHHEEVADGLC
jgi:2-dehydro-3-deoxygalactonokinase